VPELNGPDADKYEQIDTKITRRLAQRPGSYVVLEYWRCGDTGTGTDGDRAG
jgi:transposase